MQTATIIYNDRVNTYKEMKVLDIELNAKPTDSIVKRLAEARIQNLQCFSELQSFNDTGKWKYTHPLIIHYGEHYKLTELRNRDPEAFLKKYAACTHNIHRYKSFLKNDTRTDKRKSDKKNHEKYQSLQKIFKTILENDTKNKH